MIIILDGKEYAVGLNWFAVTSIDEVRQFQKEMELTHGVLKLNKDKNITSTVALAGPEYEDQVSLAGILSYTYPNLMYVAKTGAKSETGETLYYLCTVKQGAVAVEGDVIADLETIQALYASNLAELKSEIDMSELQLLGTDVVVDEFEGITLEDFSTVLEPAQRYASQCIVKTLAKEGLSKRSVVLIVILFLLGGYLGYAWLFKKPPPPPPPAAVVKPVAPVPPKPAEPERDPYEVFLEQFEYNLTQAPQPEVIPEVVKVIKQLNLNYNGWTVNSINFYGGNVESLNLNLTRQGYGNINEVLSLGDMGYFSNISVDQTDNQATAGYPMVLSDVPYIEMSTIEDLPRGTDEHHYDLISTFQSYGMAYNMSEGDSNPYFAVNQFSMQGTGLWALNRLAKILSNFDSLGINSININIQDGNYNWTIEGIIYG